MERFKKLLFGTAGIPLSTQKPSTLTGIARVKELGLGAMELEFVRSVNISGDLAPKVRKAKEQAGIALTCHGQYFINLNSLEQEKVEASAGRILRAARAAWASGAFSLTFHAGFYQGMEAEKAYANVKKQLERIVGILRDEGNGIWVRPETTGKKTQFAGLSEILRLSQEIEGVMPCIDFAHLHARTNGKENTYEEFSATLERVENALGREALECMHIHVSGINYSEKGERNHLNLGESDLNYVELVRAFRDYKVRGVVISESPNIEGDALLLKKAYESGQGKKARPHSPR